MATPRITPRGFEVEFIRDALPHFPSTGEARGRNGWFIPAKAKVRAYNGSTELTVSSSRAAELEPIIIHLPNADWVAIVGALMRINEDG